MTFAVRVLRSAEHDITRAMAWYSAEQEGLGLEFLQSVDEAIRQVQVNPGAYRKRRREYRGILLKRFPYTLYFRVVGDTVRIAAVLHHRRGPAARRRRLTAGSNTE
jgi:plasmid stabilization system protein ParE